MPKSHWPVLVMKETLLLPRTVDITVKETARQCTGNGLSGKALGSCRKSIFSGDYAVEEAQSITVKLPAVQAVLGTSTHSFMRSMGHVWGLLLTPYCFAPRAITS